MEQTHHLPRPKFVRWALMLGIVVVLNIFFTVLISVALPAPNYANYCPTAASGQAPPTNASSCDGAGGVWTEDSNAPSPSGYCDLYANCQTPYQAASDKHALYAFVAMIVLGVVALATGLFPIGSSIVSSGLSYGGVVALIIASAQYWGTAGNWLRLGIALIALLALLYIGLRKFRD